LQLSLLISFLRSSFVIVAAPPAPPRCSFTIVQGESNIVAQSIFRERNAVRPQLKA